MRKARRKSFLCTVAQRILHLSKQLLQKDIDGGHLFEIPGGQAAARARWRKNLAAGKLGVVHAPGKKPRLIGDGSVSGANARSRILEKVRLPTLHSLQRFLSAAPPEMSWTALCFDVRGAHKLFKVREDEQGFSCFVLDGKWYCYRSCYFGCRWAAYWFSRLGGLLVRLLHQFVRIPHGLLLYVDVLRLRQHVSCYCVVWCLLSLARTVT